MEFRWSFRPPMGMKTLLLHDNASNRECQRGSAASTCTKRAVQEADVLRFQGSGSHSPFQSGTTGGPAGI